MLLCFRHQDLSYCWSLIEMMCVSLFSVYYQFSSTQKHNVTVNIYFALFSACFRLLYSQESFVQFK